MNIEQLLANLAESQIVIYLDGDRLRYRAPEGALTEDMRAAITEHRTEIINRLLAIGSPRSACRGKCAGCDRRNWTDHPPKDGLILTTCGQCGHFIGYRPTAIGKSDIPRLQSGQ